MRKKIIVDLDVVTVALWDNKGDNFKIADSFIRRLQAKEFYLVSPFFLIELVLKWRHEELKERIKEFYLVNSDKLLSDTNIAAQAENKGADPNAVLLELIGLGIKDEDALLVFVSALFESDYLVTFNRKHLRNKSEAINEVLRRCELNEVNIVLPSEL